MMTETLPDIARKVSAPEYLAFGNAVLFGMAFCTVLVFTDLFFAKVRNLIEQEGIWGAYRLVRNYFLEKRVFKDELAVSVYIVFLAIMLRAFFIWRWCEYGGAPVDFPILRVFCADLQMVVGFACVIRISARTDPRNWPWIASIAFSLLLGWYTVAF